MDGWEEGNIPYPDIVQMIAMKDIKTATPSGHSVPFWMLQTWLLGKNFGETVAVSVPVTDAGIIMMTTNKQMIFNVEP